MMQSNKGDETVHGLPWVPVGAVAVRAQRLVLCKHSKTLMWDIASRLS